MKLMAFGKSELPLVSASAVKKGDNTAIKLFYFIFLISDIYVCLLLLSNISNVSNWLDLSSHSSSI